jgi:hypothetical protein
MQQLNTAGLGFRLCTQQLFKHTWWAWARAACTNNLWQLAWRCLGNDLNCAHAHSSWCNCAMHAAQLAFKSWWRHQRHRHMHMLG